MSKREYWRLSWESRIYKATAEPRWIDTVGHDHTTALCLWSDEIDRVVLQEGYEDHRGLAAEDLYLASPVDDAPLLSSAEVLEQFGDLCFAEEHVQDREEISEAEYLASPDRLDLTTGERE